MANCLCIFCERLVIGVGAFNVSIYSVADFLYLSLLSPIGGVAIAVSVRSFVSAAKEAS